jgi:hypothetical protein
MGFLIQPLHLFLLVFVVGPILLLAVLPPYWMICKKAGFSPWLSILILLPVVKWIVLWVVAFSEWKPRPAQLP